MYTFFSMTGRNRLKPALRTRIVRRRGRRRRARVAIVVQGCCYCAGLCMTNGGLNEIQFR